VNLGGVSVTTKSDLQFSLDGSPADFAIKHSLTVGIPLHEISCLNQARIYPLHPDSHMPKFFLEQISTLMQQAPLPENLARVRTSTRGCQIVSRLHAFGSVKDEVDKSGGDNQEVKPSASDPHRPSRRIWTLAESEKIRDLILQGQAAVFPRSL
jgi:hypothetical protein